MSTWFAHAGAVARLMTEVFATALGLPDDHFTAFTDHSIDVLRMNNYAVPPGMEIAPAQLGMGAHTDYGIVTVLWADAVPGLRDPAPDGSWYPVLPAPNALLINLGDLLARWPTTAGSRRCTASCHLATNPDSSRAGAPPRTSTTATPMR